MKKLLLRALAVVPILLLVSAFASADTISVTDTLTGTTQNFTCADPTACDFTANFTSGLTLKVHSTGEGNNIAPTVQISVNGTSNVTNTLVIDYDATVATGGTEFSQSNSGTFAQGSTTTANFNTCYNTLANPIFSQTVGGSGTVFGQAKNNSGNYPLVGPFTLIEQYTLTFPSATQQSFGVSGAFTIPEPASLMLLGGGFLGLANVLRRKLAK
jgi:hypothetical protein